MSKSVLKRIKETVEFQIEDVMNAENINRSESISFLKDCYESGDASVWNKEGLMFVLDTMV